jgi:phosphatidylserine/phosphatidylglycerophosphate/cardiolipin synthase-like enzyme
MAAFFSRNSIRTALTTLGKAGCTVQVLARQETITRDFCRRLDPDVVGIKIAPKPTKDRVTIHAKYVLVNGHYAGGNDRAITWMGSHNFTDNALERNDETFVEFTDPEVNAAFGGNWDRLWNDPAMSPGCGRAGAEDNAAVERSGDTEITKIARRSQTVKRALPRRLRERQALPPVRTAQGQRIRTTAVCRTSGRKGALRAQSRCRVVKRKGVPTLLIRSGAPLRVRVVQRAKGSKRLLPFSRSAVYRYLPKSSSARRL